MQLVVHIGNSILNGPRNGNIGSDPGALDLRPLGANVSGHGKNETIAKTKFGCISRYKPVWRLRSHTLVVGRVHGKEIPCTRSFYAALGSTPAIFMRSSFRSASVAWPAIQEMAFDKRQALLPAGRL